MEFKTFSFIYLLDLLTCQSISPDVNTGFLPSPSSYEEVEVRKKLEEKERREEKNRREERMEKDGRDSPRGTSEKSGQKVQKKHKHSSYQL